MENTQITPEQLDGIALDLISRHGEQLDDAAREARKNQIVEEMSNAIDKAFIDALPPEQLEKMSALSEQEDPSEEEFSAIMAEANLDNATIIKNAVAAYSQQFLNRA